MTFVAGTVLTAADLNAAIASAGGLRFIDDVTLSAESPKAVNSVFTSDFHWYRVFYSIVLGASSGNLLMQMRAAGVNNTSSNYADSQGTSGGTEMIVGIADSAAGSGWFDVFNPAHAVPTVVVGQHSANLVAPTVRQVAAAHNVSAAYDGFSLSSSTSSMTGTLRVYALAEA